MTAAEKYTVIIVCGTLVLGLINTFINGVQ